MASQSLEKQPSDTHVQRAATSNRTRQLITYQERSPQMYYRIQFIQMTGDI